MSNEGGALKLGIFPYLGVFALFAYVLGIFLHSFLKLQFEEVVLLGVRLRGNDNLLFGCF